jgi:hypothetical protein
VPQTGAEIAQTLERTRHAKRLAGRRHATVTVVVRITDGAGASASWSRRVTIR